MALTAFTASTSMPPGERRRKPDDENDQTQPAQAGATSQPRQAAAPQTFAQMQSSGQARPAPPNLQGSINAQLANPSTYGTEAVGNSYRRLSQDIDDDYDLRSTRSDGEMARRGFYDSTKAVGELSDLNVGRRTAKTELATQLLDRQAQTGATDRANAISQAMGYQGQLSAQELARLGLTSQNDQFNKSMGYNYASLNSQSQLGNRGIDAQLSSSDRAWQQYLLDRQMQLGYVPGQGYPTGVPGQYMSQTSTPGGDAPGTKRDAQGRLINAGGTVQMAPPAAPSYSPGSATASGNYTPEGGARTTSQATPTGQQVLRQMGYHDNADGVGTSDPWDTMTPEQQADWKKRFTFSGNEYGNEAITSWRIGENGETIKTSNVPFSGLAMMTPEEQRAHYARQRGG